MKKLSTRILSLLLAIIMMVGPLSYCSYAFSAYITAVRLEDDGDTYVRESYGQEIRFTTDFDNVIDEFKTNLLNRVDSFEVAFATCDPRFAINTNDDQSMEDVCLRLINKALVGAFAYDESNPYAGDFLYHSINASGGGYSPSYYVYPAEGDILDGVQYYCVKIGLADVDYYSDLEQENYFHNFVQKFNSVYINSSDSDYIKVKTIYDFIVRNIYYDEDVRDGVVPRTDPRFKSAHSAYGAICGNLKLKENELSYADQLSNGTMDFDEHFNEFFSTVRSVEGQHIEKEYDIGLAVCEGYSKLFYALCVSNGIKCHIVDGNYASGVLNDDGKQKSDPHEWNYVLLDDGVGDDGEQWYVVDTTYASELSIKEIDYNNYDYFLVGSDNVNMSKENHPVPYGCDLVSYGDDEEEVRLFNVNDLENNFERQLYDWYGEYKSSVDDYRFPLFKFSATDSDVRDSLLISREYNYQGSQRKAYLLSERNEETNSYDNIRVEIDEYKQIRESDSALVENMGFPYRSLKNVDFKFHIMIPYVVDMGRTDIVGNSERNNGAFANAGQYYVTITGVDGSVFNVTIPITALNMGNDDEHKNNYSSIVIDNMAAYTGTKITPSATIIDGFDCKLREGIDYDIKAYEDPELLYEVDEIKDIGEYFIGVHYKGNYTGTYQLNFNVGKADVGEISFTKNEFQYLPKKMRAKININNIAQYFAMGYSNVSLGDYTIEPDVDYSIGYTVSKGGSDGLDYDSTGTITLTGQSNSECIKSGSKKEITYKISEKFDIGNSKNGFDGIPASSKAYTYTGKAIKPKSFDNLESVLASDEYTIDSYSNCTKPGKAKLTVKGAGGCTGTAVMYYVINKKPISSDMVTITQLGNDLYIYLKYNGMVLQSGTDYTVSKKTDYITITAKSDSNYTGTYKIKSKGIGKLNVKYGNVPKSVELSKYTFTYNGKTQKPSVVIKDSKGKTVSSKNYKVTYPKTSKSVGTYTVKIVFSGSYSGTVTKQYTIAPKGTSLKNVASGKASFTANWNKQTTGTTGYEIRYGTDTRMSDAKIVRVSKNSTTSAKVSKLKSKKTYYVQVRTYKKVSSKIITSDWSKAMMVKTK